MPKTGYDSPAGHEFQAKSFENLLDHYAFTENGRLILHRAFVEAVPEEKRPLYDIPERDRALRPSVQTTPSYDFRNSL